MGKPGETLLDTFDRLMRERDINTYDRSRLANALREARTLRYAFAAAILSAPDQRIYITDAARHDISERDSILETEDMPNRRTVYELRRRR
jgi:hypothetical protein